MMSVNAAGVYAKMAKPLEFSVNGKFYCNRIRLYTSKAECAERVRAAKKNKTRPCCECAKGSLWLSKNKESDNG